MKKMTPREALYNIIVSLGPIPQTSRNDNLSPEQVRLRDSIRTLQDLILRENDEGIKPRVRIEQRGDGKDRIDTWKRETGH